MDCMDLLIEFRYREPKFVLISGVTKYGILREAPDTLFFDKNENRSFVNKNEVLYFGDPEWYHHIIDKERADQWEEQRNGEPSEPDE